MELVLPKPLEGRLSPRDAALHLAIGLFVTEEATLGQAAQVAPEAEAIELAHETGADWLLIDERKVRKLATEEGLAVIGLVGVVLLARRRDLIPSARELLQRLELEAGMYLSEAIREAALKTVGE